MGYLEDTGKDPMAKISAFVGHSFSENDKELVQTFLDYFNHIANLGIGFHWDHAEPAEPKDLFKKVREKMEGKNLFIAICTRKELAIEPVHIKETWLFKKLKGNRDHFKYKTSDWIIQEIAYALGRGMEIFLFVEKGIRPPRRISRKFRKNRV